VKRKDLIRRVLALGAVFDREGGDHTIYRNPRNWNPVPVPRHAEVNEITAKKIIREASRRASAAAALS
jgi:mRNA interferase HicA